MNGFDPSLPSRIREAFTKPASSWVKVTAKGFLLEGEISPIPHLEGRIVQIRLVRKLFREGALACYSADGIRARDGTPCSRCLHPLCRPQLRVQFATATARLVFDLSGRSAENLIVLQEEAEAERLDLVDLVLGLSVLDQGKWGEVHFRRLSPEGGRS